MKTQNPLAVTSPKLKAPSSAVRNGFKVLVATHETQGERTSEFSHATEGELVALGAECADEGHSSVCACRRSWIGITSLGPTNTVKVAVFRGTIDDLASRLVDCSYHPPTDEAIKGRHADIYHMVSNHLAATADHFLGTILERDGREFRVRFTPKGSEEQVLEHARPATAGQNEHIGCSLERGWICSCGNTRAAAGFVPCDDAGDEAEPLVDLFWAGPKVCCACGRIIDQRSLEVLGRNPAPTLFFPRPLSPLPRPQDPGVRLPVTVPYAVDRSTPTSGWHCGVCGNDETKDSYWKVDDEFLESDSLEGSEPDELYACARCGTPFTEAASEATYQPLPDALE